MFYQNCIFSRHKTFRDGDKCSFPRLLSDGEFQLTDPRSAKILDEVVEEVQKAVYWFLRNCRKTYFCRNLLKKSAHFCKDLADLHISVKILQICMDLQDSVQRSLQNPAEKILQIFTDSQRLKTWVLKKQNQLGVLKNHDTSRWQQFSTFKKFKKFQQM